MICKNMSNYYYLIINYVILKLPKLYGLLNLEKPTN